MQTELLPCQCDTAPVLTPGAGHAELLGGGKGRSSVASARFSEAEKQPLCASAGLGTAPQSRHCPGAATISRGRGCALSCQDAVIVLSPHGVFLLYPKQEASPGSWLWAPAYNSELPPSDKVLYLPLQPGRNSRSGSGQEAAWDKGRSGWYSKLAEPLWLGRKCVPCPGRLFEQRALAGWVKIGIGCREVERS